MPKPLPLLLLCLLSPLASASDIWRWQDENGLWHFSDKAPQQQLAEDLSSQYRQRVPFTLIFEGQGFKTLDYRKNDLEDSLFRVYNLLSNTLNIEINQSRAFKIVIYLDKAQMVAAHPNYFARGERIIPAGFYSPEDKTIYLFVRDDTEAMFSTLIHEFFHAMMDGKNIPLWTNEGLAEYLETLEPADTITRIRPQFYWLNLLHQKQIEAGAIFEQFIANRNSRLHQHTDTSSIAYGVSWSLAWYLMETPEGREFLQQMLRAPFDSSPKFWLEQHWPAGTEGLKRQWLAWLSTTAKHPALTTHQYPYEATQRP